MPSDFCCRDFKIPRAKKRPFFDPGHAWAILALYKRAVVMTGRYRFEASNKLFVTFCSTHRLCGQE
jgi:hypothetical protein